MSILVAIFVAILTTSAICSTAMGAVPDQMHYQGYLLDDDGTPLIGPTAMRFKIFDAATGGSLLWTETHLAVDVDDGVFHVLLGSIEPLAAVPFDDPPLWLEIVTDQTFPRQQLLPLPLALRADVATTATTGPSDDDWTAVGADELTHEVGQVGVGTANPVEPLQVVGSSPAEPGTGQLRLESTDITGAEDTGAGTLLTFHDGVVQRQVGSIQALKESDTVGEDASYLAFHTRSNASTWAERIRIASNGNVGIHTEDPSSPLTALGSIRTTSGLRFPDGTEQATATEGGTWSSYIDDLYFVSGNVGIGTFPTTPLHVWGESPSGAHDGQLVVGSTDATGEAGYGSFVNVVGHDGTTPRTHGRIGFVKENAVTGDYDSALSFVTRTNGIAAGEFVRLTSEGRLGLFESDPVSTVHIRDGSLGSVRSNGSLSTRFLWATDDGGYSAVYGPSGEVNCALTTLDATGGEDRGFVHIADENGGERAALFAGSSESGRLRLKSSGGDVNLTWGATGLEGQDAGYITVRRFGQTRGRIRVDENGLGEIVADAKYFRTANPSQPGTDIWYACPEGPEAAAYYRGSARLIAGVAEVEFPQHFIDVSSGEGITVLLTSRSSSSRGLAVIEKSRERVVVRELHGGEGNHEFDYQVMAVRKGFEQYEVVRATETDSYLEVESAAAGISAASD